MNPFFNLWKAAQLLFVTASSTLKPPQEVLQIQSGGIKIPAALYIPKGRPKFPGVLLCHGLTPKGGEEPRVIQFANALQRIGCAVLVPTFPEASNLRIDPKTIQQIIDSSLSLLNQEMIDAKKNGLFGVSFGGTLAFIASQDLKIRDKIAWLGSLGAFASLEAILNYGLTGKYSVSQDIFSLPPDPYAKQILKDQFGHPNDFSLNVEEFRNKYSEQIEKLSVNFDLKLSPKIKILLIHSEDDSVVPWPEMTKLAQIFEQKGLLLETYLLKNASHAQVKKWWIHKNYLRAAKALVRLSLGE